MRYAKEKSHPNIYNNTGKIGAGKIGADAPNVRN
jgi:hypothetical protein